MHISISDFTRLRTSKGFTIVELLIVIVVIAILAAITIVAYNGIQERARKTQLTSDISNIKKAMELYKADNDNYPICDGGVTECGFRPQILNQLVPKYAQSLSNYSFNYVHYANNTVQWGAQYRDKESPYNLAGSCKFGQNIISGWYLSAPEC